MPGGRPGGRARLSYRHAEEIFEENTRLLANPLASPDDIEGLDGWTLHWLRHSAPTHDAEDGTSPPMLLARSRHASVRYRYVGVGLLSLEPVITDATRHRSPEAGSGRAGRTTKKRPREDRIGELRDALDEMPVSLGEGVRRIERKQYRAYRRLRNIACVGRGRRSEVLGGQDSGVDAGMGAEVVHD